MLNRQQPKLKHMTRLQRWIIAALIFYNGLIAACHAFLLFAWPEYQADRVTRGGYMEAALVNLGLLAALAYSYRRQPPAST